MVKVKQEPDYFLGYKYALESAKKHFSSAELIAQTTSYGIANSHLVLASEEAIKAIQLFMLHYYPNFKNEDFDKFFTNHKYKHETIRSTEGLGFLLEGLTQRIYDPILKLLDSDEIPSQEQIQKAKGKGIDESVEWMKKLLDGSEKPTTNDNWWKQADFNKNKGFYVNLIKKTGQWETPEQISQSFYEKSYKIVSSFMQKAETLERLFNNPNFQDYFSKMANKIFNNKKDNGG